uniref:Uncharacterized protein n=1 Tax=Rhizophora mucronata TaxID=61149 RepID=A0A2P2NKJ4_RHIMU
MARPTTLNIFGEQPIMVF